jgi:hypothetical protein
MSQPAIQPVQPRKRKRGQKSSHMLIEGDDQSIDIVTFKDLTTNTPRGQVKKRIEVPLRPLKGSPRMSTVDMDENWEAGGNEMNIQSDGEPPAHKPAINKVIPVHYHTH